ncbi:MAG: PAS domain S-box protein, partial [Candidatus Omnitrophica bacterium]|nr:PAS domain S-box protein [Candidatus Omnitrophota bacterium]
GYTLMFVSIALVVIATILLTRTINKSLFRTISSSQIMSEGDLETPIDVNYADEFSILAQTFEDMRIKLRNSYNDLKVSKDSLERTLTSAGEAIMITDRNGKIEYVNIAFERITQYKREDVIGKTPLVLNSGQQDGEFYRGMWEKIRQGHIWEGTLVNQKQDGTLFDAEQTIAPVKDSEGNISKFVSVMRDITNRKKLEQQLQITNKELRDSEKAAKNALSDLQKAHDDLKGVQNQLLQSEKLASIGHLAAGVAHEINNPMGFIGGNIDALDDYMSIYKEIWEVVESLKKSIEKQDWKTAESHVEAMIKLEKDVNLEFVLNDIDNLIRESKVGVDRVRKIVLDLRTFARDDGGEKELIKVESVIDSVLSIVQSEIKFKLRLKKIYGDTPEIKCFSQKLGQVFINLLINAAQAVDDVGDLYLKTYCQEGMVCVEVRDTGKGIEPENLAKIFDPFYTTKSVGTGTGLGLSISYEIIKKQGGEMTVTSQVGVGTTFIIKLPVNV